MADVIERLGNPATLTLKELIAKAGCIDGAFHDWLEDRKNRRIIPHRLEACGYVAIHNPDAEDGLWVVNKRRQVLYGHAKLSQADRLAAARLKVG